MTNKTKVLFGHDHKFYKSLSGQVYSGGGLPSSVWQRYLNVFSQVTVVGREGGVVNDTQLSRMALSSCEQVSFELLNNVSTFKAKLFGDAGVNHRIRHLVSSHDAVIVRLSSEIGLLMAKEAEKQGKPYAVELVDCPFEGLWHFGGIKAKFYAPYFALQVRSVMASSMYSLYVTKKFLQKRYPSLNGITVDCSNVCIEEMNENLLLKRKGRKKEVGAPILGLIGSLSGNLKGIDTALKAVAKLKSYGKIVSLHILGSGDSRRFENLAQQLDIEKQVFFDGTVSSGKAVMGWLDEIDIYIHPSLKEGLPRSLIEAMSRGCPCVATRTAGIPELLSDDFLINKKDFAALADRLDNLLSSSLLMDAQSLRNFEVSKEYFAPVLDNKRNKFWSAFANYVTNDS